MGPSILAAAFTTFASATAMLFCTVTFFTKFALILLMTILHATIGSFVVYLVLSDTFGPSEPTKFYDSVVINLKGKIFGTSTSNEKEKMNSTKNTISPMYDDVQRSLSFDKNNVYDLRKP